LWTCFGDFVFNILHRGEIAMGFVWPVEIVLNKPFGQAEMNEFGDRS